MDKIIRINMGPGGSPEAKVEPIGDYAGLGGREMTSTIVAKEVPPLCHPLGEDNKLVIAPGLLSGSVAAMSGRLRCRWMPIAMRSWPKRAALP